VGFEENLLTWFSFNSKVCRQRVGILGFVFHTLTAFAVVPRMRCKRAVECSWLGYYYAHTERSLWATWSNVCWDLGFPCVAVPWFLSNTTFHAATFWYERDCYQGQISPCPLES